MMVKRNELTSIPAEEQEVIIHQKYLFEAKYSHKIMAMATSLSWYFILSLVFSCKSK